MFHQNLQLQGRYKFDLYDKSGSLKNSTSVDNFITPTGLDYPVYFPFADCFRYISLGSGTTANSNTAFGMGTTGLAIPLPKFSYIGGNLEEIGGANQYELSACGYREHASGVLLARGWRIPPTPDTFFTGNFVFKEAMVSPGKPNGLGVCEDIELSDLLEVYPRNSNADMCSTIFTRAFSRVVEDITVEDENFLVVTYELNVTTNTGVNYFKLSIDNGGAEGSPTNWGGYLSGIYSLIHHGVHLIRGDETVYIPSSVTQHFTSYEHHGDSFIAPLGSPLEPSCPASLYKLYLSTDNTQFLVSELSGAKMDTGLYKPYNPVGKPFPSGTAYFHSQPTFESNMGSDLDVSADYWFVNIRQSDGSYYPDPNDFQSNYSYAPISISDDGITAILEPRVYTDRTRRRKITAVLRGTSSINHPIEGQPIRSIVMGYVGSNSTKVFPFMDMILGDKTDGIRPTLLTGVDDLDFTVHNDYNVLDTVNDLTLTFHLSWSSPCPAGMGC